MLKTFSVSSCTEFRNQYFEQDTSNARFLIQAVAYDLGICMPQNFEQAAGLYEEAIKDSGPDITPKMRLALIYEYGPHALRNTKRANFLFKQIAIDTVPYRSLENPLILETLMTASLYKGTVPRPLLQHLEWLDHIMQQEFHVRKYMDVKLSEEGFKGTHYLWDQFDQNE